MENDQNDISEKKMLTELIAHINRVESRISSVEEAMSEIKDIQVLNKLDTINLKDEIEKLRLGYPTLTPEKIAQFHDIVKIMSRVTAGQLNTMVKTVESLSKNITSLGKKVSLLESSPLPEGLVREIESMKSRLDALPVISITKTNALLEESRRLLKNARNAGGGQVLSAAQNSNKELMELKRAVQLLGQSDKGSVSALKGDVASLKERVSCLKPVKIPENIGEIDTIKGHMNSLSAEVASIKKELQQARQQTQTDVEEGKKEAIHTILKELRKMVSA